MKKTVQFLLVAMLIGLQFRVQSQNFSLNFDGIDDFVMLPKNDGVLASNFTIEGWFKTTLPTTAESMLHGFTNPQVLTSPIGIEIQVDGLLRFFYNSIAGVSSFEELYSNKFVADGQWHHFAYVKEDNLILKMYVDGILDNAHSMNQVNIAPPLFIELGRNQFAVGSNLRQFSGNLDDIKIWAVIRSGQQIFNDFKREHDGTEPGIFSNYKFDEPSDTVFDCSNQMNHGLRKGNGGGNAKPQFSTDVPPIFSVDCAFGFVGTEEELAQKVGAIHLFPNPMTDEITITLDRPQNADAQVFNSEGKLLMQFKIVGGRKSLSTAQLPAGAYQLRVVTPDGVLTTKLLKI